MKTSENTGSRNWRDFPVSRSVRIFVCKIDAFVLFQGVSVSVSVLTLSCISVERWYAICYPLKFKTSTTRVRTIIILIWLIAFVILTPELVSLNVTSEYWQYHPTLLSVCRSTWGDSSQMAYELFKMIALFFLPLILMALTYGMIVHCLWSNAIPCEPSKYINYYFP